MKFNIGRYLSAILVSIALVFSSPVWATHGTEPAKTVWQMHEEGMSCSAVMVAPEWALTARHCMTMTSPVLTIDGVDYPVLEGYGNPVLDLALLYVPNAPCPCAKPSATKVKEGESVILIGFPYAIGKVVTDGEFQGRVTINNIEYGMTTAPARPGNSGGGAFNQKGELLGILSMGDLSGYLSFFVEIDPLVNIKVTSFFKDRILFKAK